MPLLKKKKVYLMNNPKITFYGGVGSTTGANIMLEFENKKILVDCGLFQAEHSEGKNFEPFKYNPADVDFLLITHAHLDHIGRVPKLVREGFKGKIISTPETMEIARPVLEDAFVVMRGKHPDKILFDQKDIEKTFFLWESQKYAQKEELFPNCFLEMQDAGHILGSAICSIDCGGKVVAFTGDLGNSPSPLLPDTELPKGVDYLVMESVYGDRNHDDRENRKEELKQYFLGGFKKCGTVVISAFSIERTQVLLHEINDLVEDGEIPKMPVFLDSPLAEKITEIYKKYQKDFNETIQKEIKAGDNIFDFPGLRIIKDAKESAGIDDIKGPKVIIAGSGMSEGGRIVNHEFRILSGTENTLVLVGYQAVGTLGRVLQDGKKEIERWKDGKKEKIKVKATIGNISGYSSHKDSEHLLEFVEEVNNTPQPPLTTRGGAGRLKKVFVIMGEPKSSLFLTQRIRDYLDIDAIYPEEGKMYILEA
jgi:metallo-beta-lactamase family protein